MRKTLQELAFYIQHLLPRDIPEAYEIAPILRDISDEESIRKGVLAFRDFLVRFYDCLIADGDLYDKPKKAPHLYADNTNINTYYPFLGNIANIFASIGHNGVPVEDGSLLMLNAAEYPSAGRNIFNLNLPDKKVIESLRFLNKCGICFDGIDLDALKPDLPSVQTLKISYLDNPLMLVGMKALETACRELNISGDEHMLLRCDYRALKKDWGEPALFLEDTLKPLSNDVRKFALRIHQRFLDRKLKCTVSTMNLYIRFIYSYRGKEVIRLNVSLNNGYDIGLRAKHTHEYAAAIEKFSEWLKQKIAKGYGCGKKRGLTDSCDGGCRGIRVPLNDSILDISSDVEAWFEQELMML